MGQRQTTPEPPYFGPLPLLVQQDSQNGPQLGTWFYHNGQIGSSALVTDALGNEATGFLYLPYGEIDQAHSNGGYSTTFDFTSQERDPESDLMYYRSRFYDPSIGRFLTPDSTIPNWRDPQAFNRYAYVDGNPIRYTDPTGHKSCGWNLDCQIHSALDKAAHAVGAAVQAASNASANHLAQSWQTDIEEPWKYNVDRYRAQLHTIVDIHAIVAGISVAIIASPLGPVEAGALGGAAGGFVYGAGHGLVDGNSVDKALNQGLREAATGAIVGATAGWIVGIPPAAALPVLGTASLQAAWIAFRRDNGFDQNGPDGDSKNGNALDWIYHERDRFF